MAIDATPGGSSSDSFVDVAGADAYHATRLHNSEWTAADTTTKESALKWATRLLDQKAWVGLKTDSAQALRWPRGSVFDRDGIQITGSDIPQFLKDATAEQAFELIKGDTTGATGTEGFSELSLDGVGSMKMTQATSVKAVPKNVSALINFYLKSSSNRVVRT